MSNGIHLDRHRRLFKRLPKLTLDQGPTLCLQPQSSFISRTTSELSAKIILSLAYPTIFCSCAVAIAAEVKATSSPRSFAASKSQWSSLTYLQIMERISIRCEATYVDDENICQYGYCTCGLGLRVWKMMLQLNITDCQKSEILPKYYTFPVQIVGVFRLDMQADLERFIALHKNLLRWWLGKYIPSYVKDIADNAAADPMIPENWSIPWQ